ncbi:MAG: hypothetical protein H6922_01355 [Pseudomonadaceae bacterium]|nr:hypothetical protein [Pseudomonadaceae bacterium]
MPILTDERQKYFADYGGIALGLNIAQESANTVPMLFTPPHQCVAKDDIAAGNVALAMFRGKKVVLKASTGDRDFTEHAKRGVGTSRNRKSLLVDVGTTWEADVLPQFVNESGDVRSIVLQEFVALPDNAYAIVHAKADEMLIEFTVDGDRFLLFVNHRNGATSLETSRHDGDMTSLHGRIDVNHFAAMMRDMYKVVGFDFNIECFMNRSLVSIIQLRPVPQDIPHDPLITAKIAQRLVLPTQPPLHHTRFVCGLVDSYGVIQTNVEAAHNVGQPDTMLVLRDTPDLPWEYPFFAQRAASSLRTVFVDVHSASTLSHDPTDLPMDLGVREHYRRFAAPRFQTTELVGRNVEILMDGHEGVMDDHGR